MLFRVLGLFLFRPERVPPWLTAEVLKGFEALVIDQDRAIKGGKKLAL